MGKKYTDVNFTKVLNFTFNIIEDNKLRIFKWKLFHYILPCKELLAIWKISNNSLCNICNVIEDYEHFFITCICVKKFWKDIIDFLKELNIGNHVVKLKHLIFGYKIQEENLLWLNNMFLIILYSIHKAYYVSEQRTKYIDVFHIFKQEFINRFHLTQYRGVDNDPMIKSVAAKLLQR